MPISVICCCACNAMYCADAVCYLLEMHWMNVLSSLLTHLNTRLNCSQSPVDGIFVNWQVFVDVGSPLEMAASIVIKAHTADHLELIEQVRTMSLDSGNNHRTHHITRADIVAKMYIARRTVFASFCCQTRVNTHQVPTRSLVQIVSFSHTHLTISPYNMNDDDGHALGWTDACNVFRRCTRFQYMAAVYRQRCLRI